MAVAIKEDKKNTHNRKQVNFEYKSSKSFVTIQKGVPTVHAEISATTPPELTISQKIPRFCKNTHVLLMHSGIWVPESWVPRIIGLLIALCLSYRKSTTS
eukprot:1103296-Amorphochlora_amoeboformis.AAC.1